MVLALTEPLLWEGHSDSHLLICAVQVAFAGSFLLPLVFLFAVVRRARSRWAAYLGAVVSLSLLLVFFMSSKFQVTAWNPHFVCSLYRGAVGVAYRPSTKYSPHVYVACLGIGELGSMRWEAAHYGIDYPNTVYVLRCPFWLFPLCAACCTVLLFVMSVKRPKCGCLTCGYNLTGNTSGICSECGTPMRCTPNEKRLSPSCGAYIISH